MARSITQGSDGLSHTSTRAALTKLQVTLGNICLTDVGIAIATTTTKVKTTAIASCISDGTLLQVAATDNFFTLAGTVTNAAFNVYVLSVTAAGAAAASMGTEGATLAAVTFPAITAGNCVVGYVIINPTGTGNFVGGTTALGDGTVAPGAIYVDVRGPLNYGEQAL